VDKYAPWAQSRTSIIQRAARLIFVNLSRNHSLPRPIHHFKLSYQQKVRSAVHSSDREHKTCFGTCCKSMSFVRFTHHALVCSMPSFNISICACAAHLLTMLTQASISPNSAATVRTGLQGRDAISVKPVQPRQDFLAACHAVRGCVMVGQWRLVWIRTFSQLFDAGCRCAGLL
jgi:hypothetical protein